MSDADRHVDELLPWYVAGTLDREESDRVGRHLATCEACRAQLPLLEDAAALVERDGAAALADHPESEQLVDAVLGDLDEMTTGRVMKHVARCDTCADEARLVRGEASPAASPAPASAPAATARATIWFAAGAMAAAAALAIGISLFAPADPARTVLPNFVVPPELSGETKNTFALPDDGGPLLLAFEADFAASALPLDVEIVGADGSAVLTLPGIGQDQLVREVYVFVECPADLCGVGSYTGRLVPSDGSAALEYPFTVE
ncbi:MAG: hypothetical protein GY716_01965 [bacterium]|nr:hypothetical protein [bacterium]